MPPIEYEDKVPVRNDPYGEGHFRAKRRGGRLHNGLDITACEGTPVFASKGGRVIAGYQKNGMGNYLIIKHPGGLSTLYGHLSQIIAPDASRVRQGDLIGLSGRTGNARYKGIKGHLHFEVKKEGSYEDPMNYLK